MNLASALPTDQNFSHFLHFLITAVAAKSLNSLPSGNGTSRAAHFSDQSLDASVQFEGSQRRGLTSLERNLLWLTFSRATLAAVLLSVDAPISSGSYDLRLPSSIEQCRLLPLRQILGLERKEVLGL